MPETPIDAFGRLAEEATDETVVAGHHPFQSDAEAAILRDVVAKLDPSPADRCLHVGCGLGNLLIPLVFRGPGRRGRPPVDR